MASCSKNERSSPSCFRTCSIAAGDACSPAMMMAGSPGSRLSSRNARIEMIRITGTACRNLTATMRIRATSSDLPSGSGKPRCGYPSIEPQVPELQHAGIVVLALQLLGIAAEPAGVGDLDQIGTAAHFLLARQPAGAPRLQRRRREDLAIGLATGVVADAPPQLVPHPP